MRVVIPHMGNIHIALRAMLEGVGADYIIPPQNSRRTLDLGVANSPEQVCLPFKLTLGNFIEGLEMGGDTLAFTEARGICRLGYYFRVQTQALENLGYRFKTITLKDHSLGAILWLMKQLTPKASLLKRVGALRFALAKLKSLDILEGLVHRLRPREAVRGTVTTIYRKGVNDVDNASTMRELKQEERDYVARLLGVSVHNADPLKIGVMGEFFVVLDPFSNLDIEMELGKLGCEVCRTIMLSKWTNFTLFLNPFGVTDTRRLHKAAMPYLSRDVGGEGWETVGEKVMRAHELDGLIHLYPFGCLPEIVARNIITPMQDGIPMLHVPLDEQTARSGLLTRLEAFVDMVRRKKEKQGGLTCRRANFQKG